MIRVAVALVMLTTLATSVHADAKVPAGYVLVAAEYGVPAPLLYSIANAESNAKFSGKPWPWTLNVQGQGYRFSSRHAATTALQSFLAAGIRNIDVGLMQVNWRWHESSLETPERALDPYTNMRVAAAHLRDLYAASGDWGVATGRYHSPSNKLRASAYVERVREHLDAL